MGRSAVSYSISSIFAAFFQVRVVVACSAVNLKKIADFKRIYDLDLTAADSHQLRE